MVEVLGSDGVLADSESVDDSTKSVGDSGNDGDNEVHDGVVKLFQKEKGGKRESAVCSSFRRRFVRALVENSPQ